jgi:hypothetical protein
MSQRKRIKVKFLVASTEALKFTITKRFVIPLYYEGKELLRTGPMIKREDYVQLYPEV